MKIVAVGRAAWMGWLELATEPVNEITTDMIHEPLGLPIDRYEAAVRNDPLRPCCPNGGPTTMTASGLYV